MFALRAILNVSLLLLLFLHGVWSQQNFTEAELENAYLQIGYPPCMVSSACLSELQLRCYTGFVDWSLQMSS